MLPTSTSQLSARPAPPQTATAVQPPPPLPLPAALHNLDHMVRTNIATTIKPTSYNPNELTCLTNWHFGMRLSTHPQQQVRKLS